MELLLKPKLLYVTESVTKSDYTPHPVTVPTKPPSLHHKPSSLSSTVPHIPQPPTCRKAIVREPLVYMPSFQKELVSLNGARYRVQPSPPSSSAGTSAQQWELKHDEERHQEEGGDDVGREVQLAFNKPLLRSMWEEGLCRRYLGDCADKNSFRQDVIDLINLPVQFSSKLGFQMATTIATFQWTEQNAWPWDFYDM